MRCPQSVPRAARPLRRGVACVGESHIATIGNGDAISRRRRPVRWAGSSSMWHARRRVGFGCNLCRRLPGINKTESRDVTAHVNMAVEMKILITQI